MSILVLDTETTGISTKDEIIELAYFNLPENIREFFSRYPSFKDISNLRNECYSQEYLPNVPIHPKATEVHGKRLQNLLGKPNSKTLSVPEAKVFIGHNISFDHRMLGKPETNLICTLFLIKKIDKQHNLGLQNHQLDTVIEYFYGDQGEYLKEKYHSAVGDVIKVLLVLNAILNNYLPKIATVQELYDFTLLLKKV
jgi:DNA polymerase III epsilon subunit-like protein